MEVIHELEGTTTLVRLEQKELHTKDGEKSSNQGWIVRNKKSKRKRKRKREKGKRKQIGIKRRKKVELVCLVQSNKGMSQERKRKNVIKKERKTKK